MSASGEQQGATITAFQRMANEQVRMRIGQVVSVTGSRVLMMIDLPQDHAREHMPTMGDLVCLETREADIVASVSGLSSPAAGVGEEEGNVLIAELSILGEFLEAEGGRAFRRGITAYPALGDIAASLTLEDRQLVYGKRHDDYYRIGELSDGSGLPAMADAKALLSNNFAILGMPGSGKSCAAACLVRTLIQNRFPSRILVVDAHNEYGRCFGKVANVVSLTKGRLAHWMLTFRELVHLIHMAAGRTSEEERELLAEAVCAARRRYMQANPGGLVREGAELSTVTVDMPLPYRLTDVVAYLDRSAHTDQRFDGDVFRRLRGRLVTVGKDQQCKIFFGSVGTQDSLAALLSSLFRFPLHGKPITVLQLADHSPGVAEIILSAVARYMELVALAGDGSVPFLMLLEDAHRYLPADSAEASLSSRTLRKIIEKAGKNNVSVGMITSQLRSVNPKVWENCGTVFAMRLASAGDQESLTEVTPESAFDTLSSVAVLGDGEAIGVGQGVPLPLRFRFRQLPQGSLPTEYHQGSHDGLSPLARNADEATLKQALDQWRYGTDRSS